MGGIFGLLGFTLSALYWNMSNTIEKIDTNNVEIRVSIGEIKHDIESIKDLGKRRDEEISNIRRKLDSKNEVH